MPRLVDLIPGGLLRLADYFGRDAAGLLPGRCGRGAFYVGCGMWGVGCGMWDVGCGMWGVGCGMWGVGCRV